MSKPKKPMYIDQLTGKEPEPICSPPVVRFCELCKRGDNIIKKFIRPHVSYSPEIVASVCYGCHNRMSGTGRSFNSPFEKTYGKDLGPLMFAKSVCNMYERAWRKYIYGR